MERLADFVHSLPPEAVLPDIESMLDPRQLAHLALFTCKRVLGDGGGALVPLETLSLQQHLLILANTCPDRDLHLPPPGDIESIVQAVENYTFEDSVLLLEYLRAQLLLNFGYTLFDCPPEIYAGARPMSPLMRQPSRLTPQKAPTTPSAAPVQATNTARAESDGNVTVDVDQLSRAELEYLLEQFQPDRHSAPITASELAAYEQLYARYQELLDDGEQLGEPLAETHSQLPSISEQLVESSSEPVSFVPGVVPDAPVARSINSESQTVAPHVDALAEPAPSPMKSPSKSKFPFKSPARSPRQIAAATTPRNRLAPSAISFTSAPLPAPARDEQPIATSSTVWVASLRGSKSDVLQPELPQISPRRFDRRPSPMSSRRNLMSPVTSPTAASRSNSFQATTTLPLKSSQTKLNIISPPSINDGVDQKQSPPLNAEPRTDEQNDERKLQTSTLSVPSALSPIKSTPSRISNRSPAQFLSRSPRRSPVHMERLKSPIKTTKSPLKSEIRVTASPLLCEAVRSWQQQADSQSVVKPATVVEYLKPSPIVRLSEDIDPDATRLRPSKKTGVHPNPKKLWGAVPKPKLTSSFAKPSKERDCFAAKLSSKQASGKASVKFQSSNKESSDVKQVVEACAPPPVIAVDSLPEEQPTSAVLPNESQRYHLCDIMLAFGLPIEFALRSDDDLWDLNSVIQAFRSGILFCRLVDLLSVSTTGSPLFLLNSGADRRQHPASLTERALTVLRQNAAMPVRHLFSADILHSADIEAASTAWWELLDDVSQTYRIEASICGRVADSPASPEPAEVADKVEAPSPSASPRLSPRQLHTLKSVPPPVHTRSEAVSDAASAVIAPQNVETKPDVALPHHELEVKRPAANLQSRKQTAPSSSSSCKSYAQQIATAAAQRRNKTRQVPLSAPNDHGSESISLWTPAPTVAPPQAPAVTVPDHVEMHNHESELNTSAAREVASATTAAVDSLSEAYAHEGLVPISEPLNSIQNEPEVSESRSSPLPSRASASSPTRIADLTVKFVQRSESCVLDWINLRVTIKSSGRSDCKRYRSMLDVVAALSDGRILCEIVADVLYKLSKRLAGTTKPAKIVVRGVHRRPETRTLKLENVEKALALCRGIPELAQHYLSSAAMIVDRDRNFCSGLLLDLMRCHVNLQPLKRSVSFNGSPPLFWHFEQDMEAEIALLDRAQINLRSAIQALLPVASGNSSAEKSTTASTEQPSNDGIATISVSASPTPDIQLEHNNRDDWLTSVRQSLRLPTMSPIEHVHQPITSLPDFLSPIVSQRIHEISCQPLDFSTDAPLIHQSNPMHAVHLPQLSLFQRPTTAFSQQSLAASIAQLSAEVQQASFQNSLQVPSVAASTPAGASLSRMLCEGLPSFASLRVNNF